MTSVSPTTTSAKTFFNFSSNLPVGGDLCTSQNAVLGAHVTRGPDYNYGNEQDGGDGKIGTILNIIRIAADSSSSTSSSKSSSSNNHDHLRLLAKVKWAETGVVGLYRLGPSQGSFDLKFAEIMVPPHLDGTPVSVDDGTAVLGAVVSRNPEHWCWGDQDLPRGGHIVACETELGYVVVKWGDESIFRYRAGGTSDATKGKYDLLYGERWNKSMKVNPSFNHELNMLNKSTNSNRSITTLPDDVATTPTTKDEILKREKEDQELRRKEKLQQANNTNDTNTEDEELLQSLVCRHYDSDKKPFSALPKESDPVTIENFRPGARVIRGPHWRRDIYGDQDLDFGGWGTLRSFDANELFVRVKWANGKKRNYRAGVDGCYDLQFDCNPMSPIRVTSSSSPMQSSYNTNTNQNDGSPKQIIELLQSKSGSFDDHMYSGAATSPRKVQRRMKELDDDLAEIERQNQQMKSENQPLVLGDGGNVVSNNNNFTAAPANVILAHNESRRRQLQRFVELQRIKRKNSFAQQQQKQKKNNNNNNNNDDDDDDQNTTNMMMLDDDGELLDLDDVWTIDVTSLATNDNNDDDDRTEIFTFSERLGTPLGSFTTGTTTTRNHKDDDDDDDDDLTSLLSEDLSASAGGCFRPLQPPKGMTSLLAAPPPRPDHQHGQQEQHRLPPPQYPQNNNNSKRSSILNSLATQSTSQEKSELSELCLRCKKRARVYGCVPCGHLAFCVPCVGQIVLEMNEKRQQQPQQQPKSKKDDGQSSTADSDDNKSKSRRENEQKLPQSNAVSPSNDLSIPLLGETATKQEIVDGQGIIHCVVCSKPVEMMIKIFK